MHGRFLRQRELITVRKGGVAGFIKSDDVISPVALYQKVGLSGISLYAISYCF